MGLDPFSRWTGRRLVTNCVPGPRKSAVGDQSATPAPATREAASTGGHRHGSDDPDRVERPFHGSDLGGQLVGGKVAEEGAGAGDRGPAAVDELGGAGQALG